MRNINELIGIIKGINFDGIINDKEVVRLQSWVDKNKNLAYETKQAELIRLVESVLEDNRIDDIERKILLEKAEEYNVSVDEENSRIYELNGIIEGIVCDGEVNPMEVMRLKKWMSLHDKYVREHKSSAQLCETIDMILEDGIVTEKEQEALLKILNSRIQNAQFEAKLEYLCMQIKERKNIGVDLIDILDNDITIHEIHERAEKQLIRAILTNGSYLKEQEIIVVSLILIAMLGYDGNYYGSVRNTYIKAYEKYSEQKVEGIIRSILSKYKKQTESGSRSRIINVALENAIVPQGFLASYFEFIFDIYKLNFEYDLPGHLYEDFQFVFEGLRNNMLSDGDNISLNVTQKTYKLIASTKRLIKCQDGLDALIKLSILIVKLIDKRYWDKEVKVLNPYLKEGYENWEKQLNENTRGRKKKRGNSTELRSRWESKFTMQDKGIYLRTPVHKVKAQYNYKEITSIVMNNDEVIYSNNSCDIREIIGGYQVNSQTIHITKPVGKLRYKLIAGNEVIYDSKEKLYRKWIVFDNEGHEIHNNTDYEGTAYFCYKTEDAKFHNLTIADEYCLGYKLVRQGDIIEIGHDLFCFSKISKPGIFGTIHQNCKIENIEDDQGYPVYQDVNVISFEADNTSSKFEIVINEKSFKLHELQYKTTVKEATTQYNIELQLEKAGIYTIEVNQLILGNKKHLLKESFVYDNALVFSAEKINNCTYRIKVVSALLTETIDAEIVINSLKTDIIRFEYAGKEYAYYLPFDFGCYEINDDIWHTMDEDLWVDDIKTDSILRIYDSTCDGLLVYNAEGVLVEDDVSLQDKGYYKQVPVFFLNSYKNINKYVFLVFTSEGRAKHMLYCYNKCVMEEEKIEFVCLDNPKQVLITPVFHGKNKVFFEVFNKEGEKIFKSKLLASGKTDIVEQFESFEEYTIRFHENTKILQLRKNTLLYEHHQTFYAKQDFVGRIFKIQEVYFNQSVQRNFLERMWHFNKVYLRLTSVIDEEDGLFEGEIFVKTMRGEWLLDKINPVEVEVCSRVIDDTLDVYITNQGDGLLIDLDKHGILNSLNHPTAPDIFLYTISTKGES